MPRHKKSMRRRMEASCDNRRARIESRAVEFPFFVGFISPGAPGVDFGTEEEA
jgi:hypothetical protein